jgi:hypothetical protein
MGRGGKHAPGDVGTFQRKRGRRTAAARAEKARREKERARERKHVGAFLPAAVRTAESAAKAGGATVSVQRSGGGTGLTARLRWTQAVIELPPTEISIRFQRPVEPAPGVLNGVGLHIGRRLFRPCPAPIIQSGDGKAFAAWLAESLEAAFARSTGERE